MRETSFDDLTTRCFHCKRFRYLDANNQGVWVDDVFMCPWCVKRMDGHCEAPKRYRADELVAVLK